MLLWSQCQCGCRPQFLNGHCDLILCDVFTLISLSIKVPLTLHAKFQANILRNSGLNVDFIGFAIFSIGGDLEFLNRLNFTILKPWSLLMLHVKFGIH